MAVHINFFGKRLLSHQDIVMAIILRAITPPISQTPTHRLHRSEFGVCILSVTGHITFDLSHLSHCVFNDYSPACQRWHQCPRLPTPAVAVILTIIRLSWYCILSSASHVRPHTIYSNREDGHLGCYTFLSRSAPLLSFCQITELR